jgi:hypothetical protein
MAILGRWTGGTKSQGNPPETWTAPTDLFDVQARNDSSTYSFNSTTSTLTLPSSGLADGYLIIGRFNYEDTHNNRLTIAGRIVQASGTGTFVGSPAGGYARNTANNNITVSAFAFVDSPSASSTYQFQWKADADDTTSGGTINSSFDVIPLYYSDFAAYTSTTNNLYGGTTPNKVTGFTGTSGTNITISNDTVSVTGDNKKYFVLNGYYQEGRGGRTQRWYGVNYDGTQDRAAQSYAYFRTTVNDTNGGHVFDIIETSTATRTIESTCYTGDGVLPTTLGGADINGDTPTSSSYTMVVLELNDDAEVIRSSNDGASAQSINSGTTDISAVNTVDFNDSASFSSASASSVDVNTTMDALAGANIGASYDSASGTRYESRANILVNTTIDSAVFHGNYGRGNQGTIDTYGWATNPVGFVSLTSGDTIGVRNTLTGNNGPLSVRDGWAGFWAVNLDTLEASAGTPTNVVSDFATLSLNTGKSRITTNGQTELFLAEFTAADGTTTASYTPDVPADGYQTEGNISAAFDIQDNQLAIDTLTTGRAWVMYDLGPNVPDNYTLIVDVVDWGGSAVAGGPGIFAAGTDSTARADGYLLDFWTTDQILLEESLTSSTNILDSASFSRVTDGKFEYRLEVTPTTINGYVDGVLYVTSSNTSHRGRYFTVGGFNTSGGGAVGQTVIDNVRVVGDVISTDIVSDFDTLTLTSYDSTVTAATDTNIVSDFDTLTLTSYDSTVVVPGDTLFLAEFTDTNGTDISAYTPDIPADGYVSDTGNYEINNNEVRASAANTGQTWIVYDLGSNVPSTYTIEARVREYGGTNTSIWSSIFFNGVGDPSSSRVSFDYAGFYGDRAFLEIVAANASFNTIIDNAYGATDDTYYDIRVDVTPTQMTLYVDGVSLGTVTDSTNRGQYIGFHGGGGNASGQVILDDLVVTNGIVSPDVNVVSDFDTLTLTSYDSTVTAATDTNIVSDFDTLTLTAFDSVVSAGTTDVFLATFTETDGTAISTYTPDEPADGLDSFFTQNGNSPNIQNNRMSLDGSGGAGSTWLTYDGGASFPTTYTISCDLYAFASGDFAGPNLVFGKPTTAGTGGIKECYLVRFRNNLFELIEVSSTPVFTQLDSVSFTPTNGQSYEVKAEVTPTSIDVYLDGTLELSSSNTDHRGQFFGWLGINTSTGSTADQGLLDNLRVFELAPPTSVDIVSEYRKLRFSYYSSNVTDGVTAEGKFTLRNRFTSSGRWKVF